uniref:Uncharacterized protein MANES_01G006400 n=1 Tax=Rhizophora mucronata TaxID=61149 RepID=A0A2P2J9Y0_RHIMU
MWPMEPQARTSTILNPTGSFDLRRLTYSLALTSPASKWVTPFCSGNPCFATFSLWKLKKTNLPKKSDRPVLRLITKGALSSALKANLLPRLTVILGREALAAALGRGLRPWNEMLDGQRLWWCFWMVAAGVKNKVDVAIIFPAFLWLCACLLSWGKFRISFFFLFVWDNILKGRFVAAAVVAQC